MGLFDFFKSENNKPSVDLMDFKFISDDHTRNENGRPTNANNKGALRGIRVKTSDNNFFYVTMYNMNENHPVWGDNIQMAEKRMKLVEDNNNKIILLGFGTDAMGSSFADYGLTLHKSNGTINKVTLHMHDRNVDIEYLKSEEKSLKQATSTNNSGIEEIQTFLNKFQTLPINIKGELAQKTDELNNIGVDYYENNDIENAIIHYNKALEIYPINDDALKNLVICYRETNNFIKMIEAQSKLDYLKHLGI